MQSLRGAARIAGINNAPLSARALAQRSGLRTPVSLKALVEALSTPPAPPEPPEVAAPLEEVHFRSIITTPKGTALGGSVDLTLRNDGTYKAHFHMHDSGAADYSFQVRAIFTSKDNTAFVAQHSGKVEGHIIGDKNRNNDLDVEGSQPFIKNSWLAVKEGSLAVTKEYKPLGVIGVVQDVASFVLDIGANAVGAGLGVVIGLGREMGQVFGDLGLGSEFGLVAGVLVFSSGGTLVLALPAGVAVGAATEALVKKRQISVEEYDFAKQVFGGSLPPRERIWLTNLGGLGGRKFTFPGIDNNNIYVNLASSFNDPMAPADGYHERGQLLIHELVHVWQIHNRTFLPGLICESVATQGRDQFGGNAYQYPAAGRAWSKFGTEQQGAIVDEWYARSLRDDKGNLIDKTGNLIDKTDDPYFRYIRDNIRQGRA